MTESETESETESDTPSSAGNQGPDDSDSDNQCEAATALSEQPVNARKQRADEVG